MLLSSALVKFFFLSPYFFISLATGSGTEMKWHSWRDSEKSEMSQPTFVTSGKSTSSCSSVYWGATRLLGLEMTFTSIHDCTTCFIWRVLGESQHDISVCTLYTPNIYPESLYELRCFSKRLQINNISGVLDVKPPQCVVILFSCLQILKYITLL